MTQYATEDEKRVIEHSCGQMNIRCIKCGSYNFTDEKPTDGQFSQCCQKGKIVLPVQDYPALLERLLKGTYQPLVQSTNFLDNIRAFNSSLGFVSMGANITPPPGYGPYCFRIQGQIYHRTGTLYPEVGQPPKFAQLYILDTVDATEQRLKFKENDKCNANLMSELSSLLNDINPFAKAYKMLHNVEQEEHHRAAQHNCGMPNIVMAIKQDRKQDPRRYNRPRVCEVAVVFDASDGEPPFNRDLLIHLKSDPRNPITPKLQRISLLHSNLDALLYPIFFPRGEQGWHEGIPHQGRPITGRDVNRRVTQLQYYSYLLSVRDGFNPLLNGGKLTQQYIVDAYVKIEANRLNFARLNQKQLRAEDYCVLHDHLQQRAIEKGVPVGRTVILPSSFQGSPRNMQQRYQDAMSIVAKYGRPDLFVTMTCNPKWKEIFENIKPCKKIEHRPDLVARVFKIKFKSLLAEIKAGLFGPLKAMVHVIEFQKRGLPHAHILIILNEKSKFRSEKDIDDVLWAEIPDQQTFPRLRELVLLHMIHGPCGTANPLCLCMKNGQCTKGFPKQFQDSTVKDRDGYPCYRRRRGDDFLLNNKLINNSWAVPYNPYLLKKYNCHINVEVCASIKSVKYLFKYVYKGHDKANIEINECNVSHDETSKFLDSRYVTAPEAIWRIFAFSMHEQTHTIVRLDVHLPNTQQIYFHENAREKDVEVSLNRISTLMAWFELNQRDPNAHAFFYREIPEHYTWKTVNGRQIWSPRARGGGKVIGRIYTVSIKDQERYYLRLLLLHVRGATTFLHLKTVNGIEHESFKDAALASGLLFDNTVWRNTLFDASVLSMPRQMRDLFAYICVFGRPAFPEELWAEFKGHFLEDYCRLFHNKTGQCKNCESYAMRDIQDVLILHGETFSSFKLPQPAAYIPNLLGEYDEVYEFSVAAEMQESLNPQQRHAYDTIVKAVEIQEENTPISVSLLMALEGAARLICTNF